MEIFEILFCLLIFCNSFNGNEFHKISKLPKEKEQILHKQFFQNQQYALDRRRLRKPIVKYVNPRDPSLEFNSFDFIYPYLLHSRSKRQIDSTKSKDGHLHDITLIFSLNNEDFIVDLILNRELFVSGYFEGYYTNGTFINHYSKQEKTSTCQYMGVVRNHTNSWAAVSTCDEIRGVVFDGSELYYIEKVPGYYKSSLNSPHYLFNHSSIISHNMSCGYSSHGNIQGLLKDSSFSKFTRVKRDKISPIIRGPYDANALSRYVELVLVADKSEYEKQGKDLEKIYQRFKDIANIVNALYRPLNIFIALVGVEVWKDEDQIEISSDGDKTLTNFLIYRKVRLIQEHPNDNAQLLTGHVFDAGVVGKALKGPICTYQYSGGVSMDHSETVGLVATTVAHEMGHNFGMEHDTEEDCKCPEKRCIMAPSSGSSRSPTHWSSCSLEYLALSFERSMDYCLRNKPSELFQSPVCGNGFVELGEQCDCGLAELCSNPCCNESTCTLYANASCATGHCCDFKSCQPRPAGFECRAAVNECDLPEYCPGDSEFCPDDAHKEDGCSCKSNQAYCYQGMCHTHEDQCKLLWGPTGNSSDDRCYHMNIQGSINGNCGYNWVNETFYKCREEDAKCGMLHCSHLNERLEFGMQSVSKVSHTFLRGEEEVVIACRAAMVDLGLEQIDPGMAPDGAKCGSGKMCINQKCMEVAALKRAPCNCNNNGACNNKGRCHCNIGWAPPDCLLPGFGGSLDSGPASNPNATSRFVIGMFIFFLGIIPGILIVVCLVYYSRGYLKMWWKAKGSFSSSRIPDIKILRRFPNGGRFMGAAKQEGTPPSSHGSKSNSPLLNGHVSSAPKTFAGDFFGKHEGFTLSPLKENEETITVIAEKNASMPKHESPFLHQGSVSVPSSPIQPLPVVVTNRATSPPPFGESFKKSSMPHNIFEKPIISNPSLQASTNISVASDIIPTRLAPSPPVTAVPPVAVVTPRIVPHSGRPLSVPDASTIAINSDYNHCSVNEESKPLTTVGRIASFLSKKEKVASVPSSKVPSNTLPRKASKLDRNSLMQLEISAPMKLQATDLPSNLVPVRPAPDAPAKLSDKKSDAKVSWTSEAGTQDLTRIGSLRVTPVTVRPAIAKFGSVRGPRPKSLPPARPIDPPPRPPLPKVPSGLESTHFYDDLQSVQEEGSPDDGIYSTIEDAQPNKKVKKSLLSFLYSSTKPKDKTSVTDPVYANISTASSKSSPTSPSVIEEELVESDLLSEIVNELANREPKNINTDSENVTIAHNEDVQLEKTAKVNVLSAASISKSKSFPNRSSENSLNSDIKHSSSESSDISSNLVKTSESSNFALKLDMSKDETLGARKKKLIDKDIYDDRNVTLNSDQSIYTNDTPKKQNIQKKPVFPPDKINFPPDKHTVKTFAKRVQSNRSAPISRTLSAKSELRGKSAPLPLKALTGVKKKETATNVSLSSKPVFSANQNINHTKKRAPFPKKTNEVKNPVDEENDLKQNLPVSATKGPIPSGYRMPTSRVASLQQKFEGKAKDSDVPNS